MFTLPESWPHVALPAAEGGLALSQPLVTSNPFMILGKPLNQLHCPTLERLWNQTEVILCRILEKDVQILYK